MVCTRVHALASGTTAVDFASDTMLVPAQGSGATAMNPFTTTLQTYRETVTSCKCGASCSTLPPPAIVTIKKCPLTPGEMF
jgi:hypothetical protein